MAKLVYDIQPNYHQNRISKSKSEKYFTEFTDHHRLVVLRSTHQSLDFVNPDKPFNYDNMVQPVISSLNVLTGRFHCHQNQKDSAIVSESFAARSISYKETIQKFSVPIDYEVIWDIAESNNLDNDLKWWFYKPREKENYSSISKHLKFNNNLPELVSIYLRNEERKKESYVPCFVRKNQIIARIKNPVKKFIRTNTRLRNSVVTSITEELDLDTRSKTYTIMYKALVPLAIGDKLMNQTGHKFTVAKILPDEEMPLLHNGKHLEMIIPFEVVKRNTPSSLVEEMCSIYINNFGEESFLRLFPKGFEQYNPSKICQIISEHLNRFSLNYPIEMEWQNNTFKSPYGYIRMYRCDNIPEEICKWTNLTNKSHKFDETKTVRISYALASTLYTRKADNLIRWIRSEISNNRNLIYSHHLLIWCLTGKDFAEIDKAQKMRLWKYLPYSSYNQAEGTILGQYINTNLELYEGTVLDKVLSENNVVGYIETFTPKGEKINVFMPPFLSETFSLPNGNVAVTSIAQLMNLLIHKTDRYKVVEAKDKTKILEEIYQIVHQYQNILSKLIFERVYDINSPRIGSSVYATGIGNSDLEINEVSIPTSIFEKFSKTNKMFEKDPKGILFRQPVHNNCEVNSVKIVPGPENVIGINPITVSLFYGDFDGDTFNILIPTENKAYKDLEKIKIEDTISDLDYYKIPRFYKLLRNKFELEIEDETMSEYEIDEALSKDTNFLGISTTFDNCNYETLSDDFINLWDKGNKVEDDMELARDAAWDMGQIKIQTSNAGSMSLAFIGWVLFKKCQSKFITNGQKRRNLKLAQDFYKFAAQNALKSKTGIDITVPKLWEEYLKVKRTDEGSYLPEKDLIKNLLNELIEALDSHIENYPDLFDLFWEFLRFKSRYKTTGQMNSNISPIFAMIRKNGNISDIQNYVKLLEKFDFNIPFVFSSFDTLED